MGGFTRNLPFKQHPPAANTQSTPLTLRNIVTPLHRGRCNGRPVMRAGIAETSLSKAGGAHSILRPGITPAGQGEGGKLWNVLGHRYYLKADCESCFAFETYDPPGTFVPMHSHLTQ